MAAPARGPGRQLREQAPARVLGGGLPLPLPGSQAGPVAARPRPRPRFRSGGWAAEPEEPQTPAETKA